MPSAVVLALFYVAQVLPTQRCSVSGTVVDLVTADPLNKVELFLEPIDRQGGHTALSTSDANGRFEITDLDPAVYRLRARRSGYLEMTYGSRRQDSDGSLIRVEAGQHQRGIILKLIREAVIGGTVRDSDGETMEDAHVTLGRVTYEHGIPRIVGFDSANTDDRGEYRFKGLSAGRFYIGVEPRSRGWGYVDHSSQTGVDERSIPTFYPGVAEIAMAVPVEVAAGSRVTTIDVKLLRSRTFRVSGRIVNAPAAGHLPIALQNRRNAGMQDFEIRTLTRNTAGEFEFRGVPPGSYQLTASAAPLNAKAVLAVGTSDVEGIRIVMAPGGEIKLRFSTEPDEKLELSTVDYFLTANGASGYSGMAFDADRFTVRNVPPDHYNLELTGSFLRRFYVKAARAGETDVLTDGLTVEGPGETSIDVLLGSDGAFLEGSVADGKSTSVAGAIVLLAPDNASRRDLFRTTATDQNGHFSFNAIPPGRYTVFAWDDIEPGIWRDPDILKTRESEGENVVLGANTRRMVLVRLGGSPFQERD